MLKTNSLPLRIFICITIAAFFVALLNLLLFGVAYATKNEAINTITFDQGYFTTNLGSHGVDMFSLLGLALIGAIAVCTYLLLYRKK